MAERSRVLHCGFRNLKKDSSGLVVSPKSSWKVALRTSSSKWCLQASQSSCLPRRSCRMVHAALWTPVLDAVVSNPEAMKY